MFSFNVGAFFVLFREALEASIILGVLIRYLDKTVGDDPKLLKTLKRQVWLGTIIGLGISVLIGVVFTVVFYVLKTDVLGDNMPLLEGILQSIAVVLLTWLAFKMVSVNDLYAKWEKKILNATKTHKLPNSDEASDSDSELTKTDAEKGISISKKASGSSRGFMFLTFSIIIREGLESVIFIAGVGGGDPASLAVPGILGILIGTAIGYGLYKGSGSLDLKLFFKVSTAILLIFAAGLSLNATWELEEYYYHKVINANVEGVGSEDPSTAEVGGFETIPERTMTIWDASRCCSEDTNPFFQVMSTLVGWKSRMSLACIIVYFSYWLIVIVIFLILRIKKKL